MKQLHFFFLNKYFPSWEIREKEHLKANLSPWYYHCIKCRNLTLFPGEENFHKPTDFLETIRLSKISSPVNSVKFLDFTHFMNMFIITWLKIKTKKLFAILSQGISRTTFSLKTSVTNNYLRCCGSCRFVSTRKEQ